MIWHTHNFTSNKMVFTQELKNNINIHMKKRKKTFTTWIRKVKYTLPSNRVVHILTLTKHPRQYSHSTATSHPPHIWNEGSLPMLTKPNVFFLLFWFLAPFQSQIRPFFGRIHFSRSMLGFTIHCIVYNMKFAFANCYPHWNYFFPIYKNLFHISI